MRPVAESDDDSFVGATWPMTAACANTSRTRIWLGLRQPSPRHNSYLANWILRQQPNLSDHPRTIDFVDGDW